MKQKLKKRPILEQWFYTQSPLVITRPALRETVSCLLFLVSGFVLACGQLAGQPAPFVLGLLAAAGLGPNFPRVATPGHPALHIRLTPKQREENELV